MKEPRTGDCSRRTGSLRFGPRQMALRIAVQIAMTGRGLRITIPKNKVVKTPMRTGRKLKRRRRMKEGRGSNQGKSWTRDGANVARG